MDLLGKDELSVIVMDLDLPALLSLCESSKDLKNKVCNNPNVWNYKLEKDYPEYKELDLSFLSLYSPFSLSREIYVFMYQLNYIKKLLNTNESLKYIFLTKSLDLSRRELNKVPAFNLPNLETLDLYRNQLTEVPSFNLPNLKALILSNNQLKEIPVFNFRFLQSLHLGNNLLEEIPNFALPNLESLYLHNNQLISVPLFKLPSLKVLYLQNNRLTEVPSFKLPNLRELYLNNNELKEIPNFDFPKLQFLDLDKNPLNKLSRKNIYKKYNNKIIVRKLLVLMK